MRKLGLIGGMSWAASEQYYRMIQVEVQRRAGPPCSAPLVIDSLNFCDLARISSDEQWVHATKVLSESAQRLAQAGATAILICANSMHKVYDAVQASVDVPILHIVDPVGEAMRAANVETAALLGTRNVMGESWYRQRLVGHGISLVPAEAEVIETVDRIIYDELMRGIVNRNSEREMKTLITKWDQREVDAVALACTELSMIVDTEANVLPIFDSTRLHAMAGVDWILGDAP
ncbi:MAG: amino acid racemase [Sphingopyxis sp.]|jgi:aspartate racemase|nr:amino acid racemase [Sphingopyxis sp.]